MHQASLMRNARQGLAMLGQRPPPFAALAQRCRIFAAVVDDIL